MRIAYIHSGADLYGASRSLLRLSRRLVSEGHEVLAVLPYEGPLRAALSNSGVQVIVRQDLPILTRDNLGSKMKLLKFLLKLPASVLRLAACLRRFRPDLIHSNTATLITPCLAARMLRVPHVWHIREFFAEFPTMWPLFQRYMTSFSDVVVCVSSAVEGQFTPTSRRKTMVIHNGFPAGEFPNVSAERVDAFRRRFSLNGHRAVGVVGRIKFGRKGQDLFLKAAAKVASSHPDTRFLCIGSPFPGNEAHLDNLSKLATELNIADRVIYTGDVEDVQAAYAALDISVLSSAQPEPFGGVVIESMALGRPVIGTRIGGTVEQVADGITGILVDPASPDEMATAIDQLLRNDDLRTRMGQNGRERFLSEFEFETFYSRILKLYGSLMNKNLHTH